MAKVAGTGSEVEWAGTFGWILAPGVATGALLGLAAWLRLTGGRRGWRWLAASPLAFAARFLSDPLHLGAFFATGHRRRRGRQGPLILPAAIRQAD